MSWYVGKGVGIGRKGGLYGDIAGRVDHVALECYCELAAIESRSYIRLLGLFWSMVRCFRSPWYTSNFLSFRSLSLILHFFYFKPPLPYTWMDVAPVEYL